MKGKDFERCLVEAMVEAIENRGLKHKPVAILAWGDRKDPATKWRKIRNGTDPRGLQVQDAYDLAFAIGVSFLELWGLAQTKLIKKNKLSNQALPSKKENSESTYPQPTSFSHSNRDEDRADIF